MKIYAAIPLLAMLVAPASLADGLADQRDSLQSAFNAGTAEDRLAAVEAVSTFGTAESTKLLISVIPRLMARIDELKALREEARSGRDPHKHPAGELELIKEQLDKEYKVLERIELAFAKLTDAKAIDYLAKQALPRERSWKVREIAARVLGRILDRKNLKALVSGLRDPDVRVRTAVLMSLGGMRAEEAVDDILKMLGDKDWMVRSAAIEALGLIRDPACFDALLAQMEKEDGSIAEACAEGLEKITGAKLGRAIDAWKVWWAENRERVIAGNRVEEPAPPEPKSSEEEGRYYHAIPVKSRRTIFIIDVSESMSYSAMDYTEKPKPGEQSRLELAKQELIRVLTRYERKGTFGLIAFNTVVKVWRPRLVPANDVMKDDAKQWVSALVPTGTTNIYAALETAFEMAGMGVGDKYYQPVADTIFLLSDGAPTNQDLSDDDIERILRAVREWNSLKRMKINTIGLRGHSVEFMSRLAEENGGIYVSRE